MCKRNSLIILLIGTFFISCGDSDIIDLPINEPRQVIHMIGITSKSQSFSTRLNVNTGWNFSLGKSYDIIGNSASIDCENWSPVIYLNDGSISQAISDFGCPTPHEINYFTIDTMIIQSGNKYEINVENASFPIIKSNYTHPEYVSLRIVDFAYVGPGEYSYLNMYPIQGDYYSLEVEIQDPKGFNYYELSMDIKYGYRNDEGDLITGDGLWDGGLVSFESYDEDLLVVPIGSQDQMNLIFTDETFNDKGKRIKMRCFVDERTKIGIIKSPIETKQFLVATLRNYSPELYEYYKTSYLQKLAERDPNGAPMPVLSNIEGGFGVFGGYAENQQFIDINLVNP